MEIQTVVCAQAKPPSATPPSAPAPEKRKRVRRWHHRGFTGCSTCRRRHVRCDEASPSCKNCTRLGLECDGTQGRMTFKVYGPPQAPEPSSSPPKKREAKKPISHVLDPTDGNKLIKIEPGEEDQSYDALVISPTTIPESKPVKYRFQEPISPAVFMSSSLDCVDGRYYTHFIDSVATLLLIYDNSINVNPYRRYFPELARSSPTMANAMQALGALHLANTSRGQQRNLHFQRAMGKYGEVVKSFRTRYTQPDQNLQLTDLATCLLLSLFEMMDSQNHNWNIHLKGAREIYRLLFLPNSDPAKEAQRQAEMNHPLRHFLVSLLSYLDVAGACATSEGTVVEGSYWRTHGGGWEYNLGIPSLSSDTSAENPLLVELRQCWSVMMEIQAAISSFGKAKSEGQIPPEQQDLLYQDLMGRLVQWRLNAPKCIQEVGELDDESLKQYPYPEVLEYAGCIESYEKATVLYLHKVAAADRPDRVPQRALLDMLASRILNLIGKLAKDVGQLAVLWPLFTAGRETRNEREQKFVRETMINLQRFGFKNVEKGLEELEKAWFKQRAFPEGWIDRMEDVRSSILLP
ncbi:fungal-specific transcription factor domain-containing protein [Aspergillus sergii]|uniref:Fungal-specific transcription factor domain-containing protein n=1 Tax=Aspergillus sergii TaxID=1034303 RepID=A0A5N6X961_9EURO|nr:fungal-specific transcription factor domain-containing protein [Aspergillus sergii]